MDRVFAVYLLAGRQKAIMCGYDGLGCVFACKACACAVAAGVEDERIDLIWSTISSVSRAQSGANAYPPPAYSSFGGCAGGNVEAIATCERRCAYLNPRCFTSCNAQCDGPLGCNVRVGTADSDGAVVMFNGSARLEDGVAVVAPHRDGVRTRNAETTLVS